MLIQECVIAYNPDKPQLHDQHRLVDLIKTPQQTAAQTTGASRQ
ncbi:hypothetical protein [Mastigocladopsis repens]|nr:hypothetical protein [Mastigocladopsis repens]